VFVSATVSTCAPGVACALCVGVCVFVCLCVSVNVYSTTVNISHTTGTLPALFLVQNSGSELLNTNRPELTFAWCASFTEACLRLSS
jgi:hypothetical protein